MSTQETSEQPIPSVEPEDKKASSIALEDALRKAAENWDLFLRARAEGDNARRRAVLDVEAAHKYGIEKFARALLEVIDSLEQGLAITAAMDLEQSKAQALKEGAELTHKLLLNLFEKFGIKAIDPMGQTFDPEKHEALSTQVQEGVEPHQVLIVMQKGYSLHDRLLRPARVIVSRKPEVNE